MTNTETKIEKQPMTPSEKEVMDAVRALFKETPEVAPNQKQIAAHSGKHESEVSRCIGNLVKKGWLKKGEGHYSLQVVS